MEIDYVLKHLDAALTTFRRDVIGLNLFGNWRDEYPDRMSSAFYWTQSLLNAVANASEVEGLSDQAERQVDMLLWSRPYNTSCSLYEVQRLILAVNDSGRSAHYIDVILLAKSSERHVEQLIAALEEMAAVGETSEET